MFERREADSALLAVRYLEGDLSDDEFARFDELLQTSDDCAELLYGLTNFALHAQEAGHAALAAEIAPPRPAAAPPLQRTALGFFTHYTTLSFTVAALFLATVLLTLALWTLPVWRPGSAPPEIARSQIVAEVFRSHNAQWAPASLVEGRPPVDLLIGQPVELLAGTVAVRFDSGALALVEGPALFAPQGRNRLRLLDGRLAARVPRRAVGFLVSTPTVDVLDLGTEFSVQASEAETEVHVLTGEVEVQRVNDGARFVARILKAGQAAAFGDSSSDGFYVQETEMNRSFFLGMAAMFGVAAPGVDALSGAAQAAIIDPPVAIAGSPPFNASYAAVYAVDGTATDYASAGAGADTYLDLDFGAPVTFDRVIAITRNSTNPTDRFAQVTYTFSIDGVFDAGDPTATIITNSGQMQSGIYALPTPMTAQYVRWKVDAVGALGDGQSAANNTGVTELLFLSTPSMSAEVSGVTVFNSSTPHPSDPAGYAATNAMNGMVGHGAGIEFASNAGLGTFVEFDLGAVREIVGFDFIDRLMAISDRTTEFSLTFSLDDTFTDVVETRIYNKGSALAFGAAFDPIEARYVRYDVLAAGGGNLGINEIIFYEAVSEPAAWRLTALAIGGVGLLLARRRRRA